MHGHYPLMKYKQCNIKKTYNYIYDIDIPDDIDINDETDFIKWLDEYIPNEND